MFPPHGLNTPLPPLTMLLPRPCTQPADGMMPQRFKLCLQDYTTTTSQTAPCNSGRELHGSATWPRNFPTPLNNTPALSAHTARRRNDALEVQVVPPRLNYDYESDCALQLHGRKLHVSATRSQKNCPKPPNNAPASSLIAFRSRTLPPFSSSCRPSILAERAIDRAAIFKRS